MARILIAEDDATSALLLERTLQKAGHWVLRAADGVEAFEFAKKHRFDAVLTDWMMPGKDGIELIRDLQREVRPLPLTMVITAMASAEARTHALNSGADEYLAKPYNPAEVIAHLDNLFARSSQTRSHSSSVKVAREPMAAKRPDLLAVAVAASTGGPGALREFFAGLPRRSDTAFLCVVHGPEWMIQSFSHTLQRDTDMTVCVGEEGMRLEGGVVYLAPGDRHMFVDPKTYLIKLSDAAPINYVKPAADPLFQSVAICFADQAVGVVLTGLGRDGARGAQNIARSGGKVLVQDPESAVAPSMPTAAIATGAAVGVEPIDKLGAAAAGLLAGISYKTKAKLTN